MHDHTIGLLAAGGDGTAPAWLWITTLVLGPVAIGADLFVVAKIHPRLTARVALVWTAIWFLLGMAFALPITDAAGKAYGIKYSTGYLLEKALTIDQVFVIAIIIRTWRTPLRLARRLVFIALTILLVLRLPFIWLGYELAEHGSAPLYITMAGLFVLGGVVLLRARFEHHDPEGQRAVRLISRIRQVDPVYAGRAFTVVRDGQKFFTLAAVVFTALLTADLYFDATIPLAFAFTKPPFIVLASTTFALFGLRSMYVFTTSIHMDIVMLKVSLAVSLFLVALDLLLAPFIDRPSWIVPVLVLCVVVTPMAICWRRTDPDQRDSHAADALNGESVTEQD